MLKLIKYEFRKQAFSKLIIATLIVLVELSFGYGMICNNENRIITSTALLVGLAIGAILFVSFECIHTYSNELKTKTGYMLFMVPRSTYHVIGAKVLATAVQIILTAATFAIFIAIYYAGAKIMDIIFSNLNLASTQTSWLMIGMTSLFTIIVYIGTAYMLEKRVSL